MKEIELVEMKIETLRWKMYQVFTCDPQSPEILKISQTLDEALNLFDVLKDPKGTE
ncbi:Spo0E family sporulation regulatory protein-aspartic acid phosphatase [Sediminibacillus dalangtanensis]|uniref:Spo0E family sporulation regulatory protein-aspartic acid phosphatase n=1 Tax=Sediminibacillus dalangtanensis TaxID=2729421 RepID=A0ABX7VQW0_9BACI|nr:aspartyl-phosphate phosphatase Spo0E family protein [Sediminibacillus dalangtanensis]QTM98903.1 Spo0E family sporulation regulatory protein-aspartic acid phosphatase [Sediminibacillus dalangtanensis]